MKRMTECLILSERSYCIFAPQGFVTKCFLIFIIDVVKNFVANNLLQVGVLVMYWESCIFDQSSTRICASKGWHSYIEEFRGSEIVKGFYCKFMGIVESRDKGLVLDLKLLFVRVDCFSRWFPPRFFYYEISLFYWFSWVIISCLI